MTVKVKVEGLRQVQTALRELPKKSLRRNVLKRVGMRRLEPIARDMRAHVAVHQGLLRESISVSTVLSKRQRKLHRKQDDVEIFAGPGPDPAGHLEEFGSIHNAPHPFVRPAWDAGKHALLEGIEDDLWAEIQSASERLARKTARLARKAIR